jgi:Ca2+-binding RTX toxin-like protein
VVSPVSFTLTTMPTGTVIILRHRWVSQKKICTSRWHDAAMKRLAALALTAALVLAGGVASAVVKTGGAGDDRLKGSQGKDTLRGNGGNDFLDGLGGDDLLLGGQGNDQLKGGPGLDDLGGGPGNDRIVAGAADNRNDRLYGGPGNDVLYVWGSDEVDADIGDDKIIVTYPGPDLFLQCGGGVDRVVLNEPAPASAFIDNDCEEVNVVSAG